MEIQMKQIKALIVGVLVLFAVMTMSGCSFMQDTYNIPEVEIAKVEGQDAYILSGDDYRKLLIYKAKVEQAQTLMAELTSRLNKANANIPTDKVVAVPVSGGFHPPTVTPAKTE